MLRIPRRLKSTLHERKFDAVIIGGGHNGLVAAAYLAKAGKSVAVLERRHVLGGTAVTEEIIRGFKFSRASYLLSLLRPQIVKDLELKRHGLKVVYLRNPNSFIPILGTDQFLLLGNDEAVNKKEIAKFSKKDAEVFAKYEHWMSKLVDAIDPLLDTEPVDVRNGTVQQKVSALKSVATLARTGANLGRDLPAFYELIASKISATLATDAVIGAMNSPKKPGSGYVLLHHVMGELEGIKNAWGYPEGGNGAVSMAIARSAQSPGAGVATESPVAEILTRSGNTVAGVRLEDGSEVRATAVLSNATPEVTFMDLLPEEKLPGELKKYIEGIDYTSAVTKINVALLPCSPNPPGGAPAPHHQCTIHLNTEHTDMIHDAYLDAEQGRWSKRPTLEVCIPTSLDSTMAPPGCHVMSIFSQYTPYHLSEGPWTEERKQQYTDLVLDCIEEYAPGFKQLVVGTDTLTPPDLERVFGLTGGNIFHGSMSLDQLYLVRPTPLNPSYATAGVKGLYLCGSGAHPGGGVMGSPGRLAALAVLEDLC